MTVKLTPKVADALADRIVLRCAEAGLVRPGVELTEMQWEVVPEGLFEGLKWVNETYQPKEIMITTARENVEEFRKRRVVPHDS